MYFLFAYYFHWMPQQVDELSNSLVEELMVMLPAWVKKINEVSTHG